MTWPVDTPCRIDDQPDLAFRIASTPVPRPGDDDPQAVMYLVKSVDGEQGFYVDEEDLLPLDEDGFCECGKIACTEGNETWGDLVRKVAAEHGVTGLDDSEINHALWEETPFPLVGRDKVTAALHAFFAGRAEPTVDKDSIIRRLLGARDTDDVLEPPPADYYRKGWYVHVDWGEVGPFTDEEADYMRSLIKAEP